MYKCEYCTLQISTRTRECIYVNESPRRPSTVYSRRTEPYTLLGDILHSELPTTMKNRISYQYKHSCSKISFQLKDLFFDTCTYITRCALSSYRVLQDAFPMLQCKLRIYVDMLRAVVLQAGISAPGVRVMGLQSCRICPISHSIYCNTQLYINLGSSRQVYFQTSTK